MRQTNKAAERKADERVNGLIESFMQRWKAREGEKVTCPYCGGTGNDGRGTECGFCEDGVHTLGT